MPRQRTPRVTGSDLSDGIESDLESDVAASRRRRRHSPQDRCQRPPVTLNGTTNETATSETSQQVVTLAGGGEEHRRGGILESLGSLFSELPRVQWRLSPKVLIKLRKIYYPLGLTRLTVGVDYDIHDREWEFKWAWKDRYLGAKISWEHGAIGLSRRFVVEERTSFDIKALFDTHYRRLLFSVDVLPFRGLFQQPKGFAVRQNIPLDKKTSVDIHARVQLPETTFTTSDDHAPPVSFGEGQFVIDIEQLNFRLLLD